MDILRPSQIVIELGISYAYLYSCFNSCSLYSDYSNTIKFFEVILPQLHRLTSNQER